MLFHVLLVCLLGSALSAPTDDFVAPGPKCGYQSCHKIDPGKLNVHIIPHSHDDVGWKKTYDQYYFGTNEYEHRGVRAVQSILDSVVQALKDDPNRRFSQVETSYFSRWWDGQTPELREMVRGLVNGGQLEMVSGGWSMNDEAATNYQSIIDQMTLGLRTLEDLLGKCGRPRVGWQIDPFGHTNAMATVFAELGFDGLFFWRMDYRDYEARHADKRTEFVWRGSSDLGAQSDIFTSMLYENYNAPYNFCWDVQCGDERINDDKTSRSYNADQRVKEFHDRIIAQASKYSTNNILITMGGDFTFAAAEMYYNSIDLLIKGFKEFHPEINMIYSTPSCYVNAVHESAQRKKLEFTLETHDFMPYATDKNTYWTGYYTSRPNSKRFERQGNNLLQVAKHLVAFEHPHNKTFEADLLGLKRVMGVMQHHDAITGTEKQHVTNDYVKMMSAAAGDVQTSLQTIVFDLLKNNISDASEIVTLTSCLLANVSRCAEAENDQFTVAVYNPHGKEISHFVRIPVVSASYSVIGLHGGKIPAQISPVIDTFPNVPGTASLYELTFEVKDIGPLGVNYFYVVKEDQKVNEPNLIKPTLDTTLGTSTTGIELDQATGLLKSVTLNGVRQSVSQQFLYYKASNRTDGVRASGAYIFRPVPGTVAQVIGDQVKFSTYKGELYDEVHQTYADWLKQVIRVYKDANYVEFDWIVGPLGYVDNLGVEVITRYTTDLNSGATFYTDSNGRQLVKRTRNTRPTYAYTNEQPISGNYYPVTSRIAIKDEEKDISVAILNDRSQGGSSLKSGEIELMLHRRLMNDDEYGVDEVLDEKEYGQGVVARGRHYMVLGTNKVSGSVQQVNLAHRLLLSPWTFVGKYNAKENNFTTLRQKMNFEFAGLTRSLPDNVRLLTLESLGAKQLLFRLEHPFSKDDDASLGTPVTVDLKGLLTSFEIKSFTETTLGSNQLKADNVRLQFPIKGEKKVQPKPVRVGEEDLKITLHPMEIRTFILNVEHIYPTSYLGAANINLPHILVMLSLLVISLFNY
ncbi:lysosomal alpha-mannosidase-like [Photinus pyralis]|nr:lysosomal alpha-mannosidase-like [Photinus pyralis]